MDCTRAYLDSIAKSPQFSPEEEKLLWERMRDGREARRLLIESQLKAVVKEAGKWKALAKSHGIPFDDLVQTANASVVKVVDDKFDPSKGRLNTILRHQIRKDLDGVVGSTDRLVKRPRYFLEGFNPERSTRSFQSEANATGKQTCGIEEGVLQNCESDPSSDLDAEDHLKYVKRLLFSRIVLLLGDGVSLRDIMLFLDFAWINHGTTMAKVAAVYKVSPRRAREVVCRIRKLLKGVEID